MKRIREVYESPVYTAIAKDSRFRKRIPQAWFADLHDALGAALRKIDVLNRKLNLEK